MPWRGAVVTTGVVAVGAVVLGGTAASAPTGPAAAETVVAAKSTDEAPAIAQAVPAQPATLRGFAPPAEAAAAPDAQFRIAANLPSGPLGIPGVVLQAYKLAAKRVAAESPQCQLPWYLLAGIGRIESGHAGGGNVDDYGNTRTKIRGPVLDGSLAGNAVITDTDGGKWDGDAGHDRAMGPMQFIPSTWASWGSDANGDGKADPDNIFDATYAAGRYLCAGVTDIMNESTRVSSVLRYNRSVSYANNVIGWALAYATGTVPIGGIPEMGAEPADDKKDDEKDKSEKDEKKDEKSSEKDAPSSSTAPKTTPKPKPHQNCLGAICLPPGIGPTPNTPQKKAPKAGPKTTEKSAPATSKVPTAR